MKLVTEGRRRYAATWGSGVGKELLEGDTRGAGCVDAAEGAGALEPPSLAEVVLERRDVEPPVDPVDADFEDGLPNEAIAD